MKSETRKLTLVPRYSTFAGAGFFPTRPVAVGEFVSANFMAWTGESLGGGTISIKAQQSQDMQTWVDVAILGAETSISFALPWMRLLIEVGGGGSAVVICWVVGDFFLRETAAK